MTEPDEALIWARQYKEHRAYLQELMAVGYRAGQAASAERIKALEEALRGGLSAVSESYRQAVAEVQGYDRVAERHDQFVVAWKAKARALLKEADQ